MNNRIFITGTNTDIGKTFAAAMIMSAAHAQNMPIRYFKPIQTGTDCDCTTVKKLTGLENNNIIKPIFSFQAAQAPYRAALEENKSINMDSIVRYVQNFSDNPYIIEGAGGLLVPLTEKHTIRDLIKALNLPIIIVASTKLGTLNHTLLTIEAAQNANIKIAGLILSGLHEPGLQFTLEQFTNVPILAEIPVLDNITPSNFSQSARKIFPLTILSKIFTLSAVIPSVTRDLVFDSGETS